MSSRVPRTQFTRTPDGAHLAYQLVSDGPVDLVFVPGFPSHIELAWENLAYRHLLHRLASFSRLIWFDARGMGLSDRATRLPGLDQQMDDVATVMDAAGSTRAVLFGNSTGAAPSVELAVTHPERVSSLVTLGFGPRIMEGQNYPWGWTPEFLDSVLEVFEHHWGQDLPEGVALIAPSAADDPPFCQWFGWFLRAASSPSAAIEMLRVVSLVDLRAVLPTVSVPTLVLQRSEDPLIRAEHGRYAAAHIRGASYVEIPGRDSLINVGDVDRIADEIEQFVTGVRVGPPSDRVLATVLFTDIVTSTEEAAKLGDARWHELLDAHDALVRRQLDRFRGKEVKATGDGFLATFDGPARAIQCADAIRQGVHGLSLRIRAGIHTGEIELRDDDVAGIAVHIAQRIQALAEPDEVLVSSTVKDLVAGSDIGFHDRGTQSLKGLSETWQLFSAAD